MSILVNPNDHSRTGEASTILFPKYEEFLPKEELEEEVEKAKDFKAGDMVSWNSSGGRAQGKIIRVFRDEKFKVPNSSFTITGTPEEPAAEIRLYRGGEPTQTIVGHKIKTLTTLSKSQPSMGQVSQGGKPPKKKENYR
jgi:hypothetical protein